MGAIIFKSVGTEAEAQSKLIEATTSKRGFSFRDQEGNEYTFLPTVDGPLSLEFTRQATHPEFEENQTFRVNFNIGEERYLAESSVHYKGQGKWYFKLSTLFYSQKRRHHRYNIPTGYPAYLQLHSVNQNKTPLKCTILDLSTEGCAILINLAEANLNINDFVKGTILINSEEPLDAVGLIKNIRERDALNIIVGIEFTSFKNEFKIVTCLAAIQRDLYFSNAA